MKDFMLWFLVGFLAVMAVLAVANWWVAERDERRWRRHWVEEQQAALIRERRYGSSKQGRL